MPVTVFTCLLETIVFQIAYTYKWWTIHQYIVPWGYMMDVSFVYGLFAVGTFWIFYFTSHKFWLYVVTNAVADALFNFGIFPILGRLGITSLVRTQAWQIFLLNFAMSFVIYGYHLWQQGVLKSPEDTTTNRQRYMDKSKLSGMFRIRTKVK